MRRILVVAGALVALGFAGEARAVALPFTGTLAVQLAALDPVVISGSGVALVNGSGGPGHLTGLDVPNGAFATSGFVLPVTDPIAYPINGVKVTVSNGNGVFAGSGGAGFGGVMPMLGSAKVCLLGYCSSAVANLTVPLSVVGVGGAATVEGLANLTVVGAPWTTATAAAGTATLMGGVGPASNTGAPSGSVTLVTPIFISTNIPGQVLTAFAILSLHFVPEPGTLLLLGSGVVALVAFGRRKLG